MTEKIAVALGTRPEIIKLSPVIKACSEHDIQCTIIHTGQHYSENLDTVFFEQLELPEPDINLKIGSASHGEQTGKMVIGLEEVLEDVSPEILFVQGDTNSVLAGAIAASKMDVTLGHVEAGLRSSDRDMPEEINRVLTDHASDHLFAPTKQSKENLLAEGIPESRIEVTGNTVVDALYRNRDLARQQVSVIQNLGLEDPFFLMTLHRAENVDDRERFKALLFGASRAADKHDADVLYPAHPRATKRIDEFGLEVPEPIRLVEPCEYLQFLRLEDEAELILTDSGGVQEEACILKTPCVTLRDSTERPETVAVGANELAAHDPASILESVDRMLHKPRNWANPFGDGNAGERILQATLPGVQEVRS